MPSKNQTVSWKLLKHVACGNLLGIYNPRKN